jgi:bacterioferritin
LSRTSACSGPIAKGAIAFYASAARQAADIDDIGTGSIFERIVMDEEAHMGWLELQLDLLKRMGEPAYISKHMSAPGEEAPA